MGRGARPRAHLQLAVAHESSTIPPGDPAPDLFAQRSRRGNSKLLVWHVVRKYWATAVGTLVVVAVGAVFYTLGQKRIYEAEATIHFDPNPPRPLGTRVESVVEMGANSWWGNQEYYETQYHIIRSRRVALAVVNELGLQNDQLFLQDLPDGAEPMPAEPAAPEAAAEVLRGRLVVQPVRDSRLATIKLRDASPARAQRILSVLIDSYVNQNLDNALQSTSSATDWLRNQLDTLKKDLESSELELHRYKKKNDILSVAFDDKSSMLADEMKQVNTELTSVKAKLQEAAARRSVLSAAPENDPTLIQATQLHQNALMNQLRAEYEQAVRDRDALLGARKAANHPDVAAADRRVKAAETAILKEIRNVKGAVDRDVTALSRQSGGLQSMLDESKRAAHELNLLEIEFNRLRRSKDNTEKLYSLVLERTKEADLTQMLKVNNIDVIDRPLVPSAPVHPRVPLNLAVGILGGLLLGIGAAFGRSYLDRTLKVPDDVEEELGVTCLGLLPQFTSESTQAAYGGKRRRGRRVEPPGGVAELVAHEEPASSIAEASRTIRTNLMFMAPDKPYRRLLVTSAGPSEGKTTVACCIAIAMAQAGQRVVLVDCDLRRPRIHRIFHKSSDAGVTTAMLDDPLDQVVQETEIPNLWVVPAGPIPPNPAELFHTEKFARLLDALSDRFDRVIIDSPPVAAVTDPAVLSTLADGTVLVVRAFKTRKELARHAVRTISDVAGSLAGAILNAVDFSRIEYKYYYYYYRRDGYYTGDRANARQSDASHDHRPMPPSA